MHARTFVARQLLCGAMEHPTSVRNREVRTSPLSRQMVRTLGGLYVAIAPLFAIGVLLSTHPGELGMAGALLLMPIALCYAPIAAHSFGEGVVLWRRKRARANVGRELLDLGREYRVLSRCSVTPGREDHIAIGPNGIFVIMACEDGGRVTASQRRLFVNARLQWRDLVDDCRVDTLRVRERIRGVVDRPLPVHSVLCFARALVAVGQEIQGVKVVQAARLSRLISSTAVTTPLTEGDIERAAMALTEARRPQLPRRIPRRSRRSSSPIPDRRLALVGPTSARRHDR